MQIWQNLLTKGNEHYHDKNWYDAEIYYREAEDILNRAWMYDRENDSLLMAWVCSAHNLAALYEVQNEHVVAMQYLLLAHNRILNLTKIEEPNNDIKFLAMKILKITLAPIITFKTKYPICEDCMEALMGGANKAKQIVPNISSEHIFTQLERAAVH